jgi:hypothetical protein
MKEIEELIRDAMGRAGKAPVKVLTAGSQEYSKSIISKHSTKSRLIIKRHAGDVDIAEPVKRVQGRLNDRTKVLNRLKSIETVDQFAAGFSVYYNYLSPGETIESQTPAEKAGLSYTTKSWLDITRAVDPDIHCLVTPARVSIHGDNQVIKTKGIRTQDKDHQHRRGKQGRKAG